MKHDKINSDKPQTTIENDLYGYEPFARSIASTIARLDSSDGLVMAIHGPWGSGKSTALEFIKKALEDNGDSSPWIINYNPWWFSGTEDLARSFFKQLAITLPKKVENDNKALEKIGTISSLIGALAGSLLASPIAAAAVGTVVDKSVSKISDSITKPLSVPEIKEKISENLLDLGRRILIIIDDIDRLTPEEIRQLFTVVKAIGDFPNVTYLLAFDRQITAEAISKQTGLPGEKYIEKIVQVSFELPTIRPRDLFHNFLSSVDGIMHKTPKHLFSLTHLKSIINSGFNELIQVPRDAVRVLNALRVTYPGVRGNVNSVDFLVIETLRILHPTIYDKIKSNPISIINGENTEYFHITIKQAPQKLQKPINRILCRIFPEYGAKTKEGQSIDEFTIKNETHAKHICAGGEIFHTYFCISENNQLTVHDYLEKFWLASEDSGKFALFLSTLSRNKEKLFILEHISKNLDLTKLNTATAHNIFTGILTKTNEIIKNSSNDDLFVSAINEKSFIIDILNDVYSYIITHNSSFNTIAILRVCSAHNPNLFITLKQPGLMPGSFIDQIKFVDNN